MRKLIQALIGGSLAFGLVAAVASGTSFNLTVSDIVATGTANAIATIAADYEYCDGDYELEWEYTGSIITGFTAIRTPNNDPDDRLPRCAGQPFSLEVSFGGGDEAFVWIELSSPDPSVTDINGDIINAVIQDPDGLQLSDWDEVRLTIGPDASEAAFS